MKDHSSKSENSNSHSRSSQSHSSPISRSFGDSKIGLVGVLLAALIGALFGYSLNFDPDFHVSLNAITVTMDRGDTGHNTMMINDKCPRWLRWIKHYNSQIYPRVDKLPNGSTVNFYPRAINTLEKKSREFIEMEIDTPDFIEPGSYLIYVDVYGADTKKKTCMMELIVRR